MALNVATLLLILYRTKYKTIEHVLHCENIIYTHSYLVSLLKLFAVPFLLNFFICFTCIKVHETLCIYISTRYEHFIY